MVATWLVLTPMSQNVHWKRFWMRCRVVEKNLTNIFSIGWFNHPLPGSIWLNVLFFPLFARQVTFRVSNPNSRVAVAPEISKKIHDGSWWIHRGPLGPLGPLPPAGWGRWLVFTWFFHLMDWVRQTISSYLSELWNDEKKHRRDREFHGYKHKGQRKRIDDDEEDDTVRYWMFHGKQDEIYNIYIYIYSHIVKMGGWLMFWRFTWDYIDYIDHQ